MSRNLAPSERLQNIAMAPVRWLFAAFEKPFQLIQRVGGIRSMPYVFLLPNLLFFGAFVILPLFINLIYSTTGGTRLFLSDRVYTGTEQYALLFDCDSYADPTEYPSAGMSSTEHMKNLPKAAGSDGFGDTTACLAKSATTCLSRSS